MKKTLLLTAVALATALAGCVSTETTETASPVKQADGTYVTNWTKVVVEKHADPLKDKVVRLTHKTVGLDLQLFPSPAGTSSGLSPLSIIFGMDKMTWVTIPVYAPANNVSGYTPPLSYAASGAGSLWNDSDVENLNTVGQLPGTNAYYATPLTPVNIIQPLTGTVSPSTVIQYVTNTVTATSVQYVTNAVTSNTTNSTPN